jgi:hypothetical protein
MFRKKLLSLKGEKQQLSEEREQLEERAGMLKDTRLLADFR